MRDRAFRHDKNSGNHRMDDLERKQQQQERRIDFILIKTAANQRNPSRVPYLNVLPHRGAEEGVGWGVNLSR